MSLWDASLRQFMKILSETSYDDVLAVTLVNGRTMTQSIMDQAILGTARN